MRVTKPKFSFLAALSSFLETLPVLVLVILVTSDSGLELVWHVCSAIGLLAMILPWTWYWRGFYEGTQEGGNS